MENRSEPRDVSPCVYVPPREDVMQSIVHPQPWLEDVPPKSAPGPAELSDPPQTEERRTPVTEDEPPAPVKRREAAVKPRNVAPVKPKMPPRPATPKSEPPVVADSDVSDDEPIF